MGSLFGGGSDNQAKTQQAQYYNNKRAVTSATKDIEGTFSGFNPKFYDEQYRNLVAAAEPQEQQQFKRTSDQLGFKLASQGLEKSSQATKLGESLRAQEDIAQQGIANQAHGQVNQLRQGVNQTESNLIGQASIANNPGEVAQGALQTASGFQSPLSLQPVGDLFQNWANVYLARSQNSGVNAGNAGAPLLGGGAFGTTGGYGSSFMQPVQTVR